MAVTRLLAAIALTLLAACGRPPVPEEESAQAPRPLPDTLSHADTIVADLKKREAVQRTLEEQMPKPSGEIPVVIEMPPPEPKYRPRRYQNYVVPTEMIAGSDEGRWKSEARLLDIQLQTALKHADAALASMEAARAEMDRRNAATFEAAQRDYAEAAKAYQFLMGEAADARSDVEKLRDAARRAGVPPGWARWP